MQLQGLLIMLFVMAVIPIMILSANHEIFFALMSVILLVSTVKNLHRQLCGTGADNSESDGEMEEEFEGVLNLDMERFSAGIEVAKNLIIILFLVYCAFFLNTVLFKSIAAIAIVFQIYFIVRKIKTNPSSETSRIHIFSHMLSNSLNLVVLLLTVFNKLTGNRF